MLDKNTPIGLLAPVCNNIPPSNYGPWEKVVYNIAKGLVQAGYRNVILYATAKARVTGVKLEAALEEPYKEGNPAGHAQELFHISKSIYKAKTQVQILHNHLNYYPLFFCSNLNVPVVTTLHGLPNQDHNTKSAFLFHREHPYISISDAERKGLPQLNYISTVYNGLDFTDIPFEEKSDNYLVYTGRIHPDKGIGNAIELSQRLGIKLYLAGIIQREQEDYFNEEVRPYLGKGKVEFLGNLYAEEVIKLVSKAFAYVGLIEWEEPFGLSIAEAMASGTPAIASNRGSHSEIVLDGVNGILVRDLEEAIRRFPDIAKINRSRCREASEHIFGLSQMIEGYLGVYNHVLSTSYAKI